MLATLRICQKQANLREVPLGAVTLVGRSADCQLRIASAEVSRRHCQLLLRPDGVYLEDLGSANGTFLDGIRVPQHLPTYAHPGARLEIGPARFLVEYAGESVTQLSGPETLAMLPASTKAPPATAELASPGVATEDALPVADPFQFSESIPAAVTTAAPETARRSFLDFFRRRPTPAATASSEESPSEALLPAAEETLLTDAAHIAAAASEPSEQFAGVCSADVEIAIETEPAGESLPQFLDPQ
jgi:pSer/pThr/pTyr-binding forkhead associated (FHA) protein